MAPGLALSQIGQIAINIHDLDRAVAFYRDVLGMKLLFQVPPKMAFFDCNGVRLMLSIPEDAPEDAEFNHPASILYYKVDDLHAAWATLREHGAELRQEPNLVARMADHDLWMAFFRDTEGNTLGLMSEVRG
jgi:predicted enzyme related to lactoylglutathione lyase